jgi:peptide/nickel transport system substrate-binding protein
MDSHFFVRYKESSPMKLRIFLKCFALLVFAVFMSSAKTQTVGNNPIHGDILNMTVPAEPNILTSAFFSAIGVANVSSKIFDGLVAFDVNLKPVPVLATHWQTSPDGLAITFNLRKQVNWHDGKAFTSADVKFSLEDVWQKLHPYGKVAFGNVKSVETPDAHTVILRLSAPAPYILNYINTYGAQILPRHIYAGTDILANPANVRPIGTGPFVFKEWVKGSHIRLERNPNYWQDGQPYLDGIIFKFIPEAAARAVALQAGELDVAVGSSIPLTSLSQFQDETKYSLNTTDGYYAGSITLLQFNLRRPPFNDIRVRRAFAHAIDRHAYLKTVFLGYGKAATGPIPTTVVNYYTPETRQYPYDLERAKQLLDEAGYKPNAKGIRLNVTLDYDGSGGVFYRRQAEFFKPALAKIGVVVDLRGPDNAVFLRRVFTDGDYDLMTSSLFRLPDPTLGVQRLFWTKNIRKGIPWTNGSGYSNPKLDTLMEQVAREPDEEKRKAQIREWQQIVQEDLPVLDLVEPLWVTVSTSRFKKQRIQGDGMFASYADAWLEPKK